MLFFSGTIVHERTSIYETKTAPSSGYGEVHIPLLEPPPRETVHMSGWNRTLNSQAYIYLPIRSRSPWLRLIEFFTWNHRSVAFHPLHSKQRSKSVYGECPRLAWPRRYLSILLVLTHDLRGKFDIYIRTSNMASPRLKHELFPESGDSTKRDLYILPIHSSLYMDYEEGVKRNPYSYKHQETNYQ